MAIIKKRSQMKKVSKDVETREPSCTLGNINWFNHCGKQYGGFPKLKIKLLLLLLSFSH